MKEKENGNIVILEDMDECCGCYACKNVCPKEAIDFTVNSDGFSYPHIITDRCITCKMCVRACPINQSKA